MRIINFFKKYKLVIFLVVLIVILGFIKVYFKESVIVNNDSIKTITNVPTPTSTIIEENNQTDENKLDTTKLSAETLAKYKEVKTEEEFDNFYNQLPNNEKEIFSTEENPDEYCLEDSLPYETETFVVEKYIGENLLLVKSKGSDFVKSKNDLKEWLNKNECEKGKHVFIWEK